MFKKKMIIDKESGMTVLGSFDKVVTTERYEILFNTKTGFEVMRGINGYEDPFVLDYPSMIDCGIMGHCQNKCAFCYQGDNQQPNMSLENYKLIIDQSKHHVSQLALGGRGEPNQHENFEEIMKYTRENNIAPNYTTSGNNLTDRQVDITKEYAGAVAVSAYGEEYTYDALKRFMDAGVKTNIHMIFSSLSADVAIDLVEGYDVFDGKVNFDKLNAIIFLLFKPQGRGKNLKQYIPNNSQIARFAKAIETPRSKFKIGMDSCLVNKVSNHRSLSRMEKVMADTCEGARMSCYITPDMKFMPCSFGNHDKYGISIQDTPIKEVWEHGKSFINFREALSLEENRCPYEKDCWV